jgi:diguanylate cyclase (GGDEF)-like protein/PAS domain S-box-containing protein
VQSNDEQYRLLVETSPDGLLLTDLSGTILMANTAAARLHGAQTGDQLLGRTTLSLFDDEDRDHLRAIMQEAVDAGHIRNAEFRLQTGNDSVIAEYLISAIQDEGAITSGFVYVVRDITSQRRREEQLKDRALHDPLTGLPNRILFNDRLTQAIEIARRTKTQVGVLYIDLDYFKQVNDSFGHDQADLLLQQVARRTAKAIRASDTLARLGGDEFAVVLPHADAAGVQVTAEKLKSEFGTPFRIAEHSITMAASIGIALFPLHGDDPATILRRADMAMYAAKHGGRRNIYWRPEQDRMLDDQHCVRTFDSAVPVNQVDPRVLTLALERHEHARVGPSE